MTSAEDSQYYRQKQLALSFSMALSPDHRFVKKHVIYSHITVCFFLLLQNTQTPSRMLLPVAQEGL